VSDRDSNRQPNDYKSDALIRDDHGNEISSGNGNSRQNWKWEWEGMRNNLHENGNGPYSYGNKFPSADAVLSS